MTPINSDDVLKELEFELEEGAGPRFLLAVCDDDSRAEVIRQTVDERLALAGKESVSLSSDAISGNIVDAILHNSTTGKPAAVHLIQATNSSDRADTFLRELNFQRDSISKLSVPVVLWTNSRELPTLASRAPDLWSRRTSTLNFDTSSVSALLERIFGVGKIIPDYQADEIATALRGTLQAESGLNDCLSMQRKFSLRDADGFIQKLRVNAGKLLQECSKGRTLDVALWLWNAGQMDLIFDRGMKSKHGLEVSLNLDRNDLLLAMARQVEELLTRYLSQIERLTRSKHRISLLELVSSASRRLWINMIAAATHEAARTKPIEFADDQHYEPPVPYGAERTSGGRAAMELELWLVGAIEKKPKIFSDQEAEILRYLYRKEGQPTGEAPLPLREIQKMLPLLKEKVRLFLDDVPVF